MTSLLHDQRFLQQILENCYPRSSLAWRRIRRFWQNKIAVESIIKWALLASPFFSTKMTIPSNARAEKMVLGVLVAKFKRTANRSTVTTSAWKKLTRLCSKMWLVDYWRSFGSEMIIQPFMVVFWSWILDQMKYISPGRKMTIAVH